MLTLIVSVGASADVTSIWQGEFEFAADGSSNFPDVAAEKFANMRVGDKIVLTFSQITNTDGWAQVSIAGKNPWTNLPNANWSTTFSLQNTYTIDSAELLANIQSGGIGIQGKYFILTDISLLTCPKSVCVWEGEYTFPENDGWQSVGSEKFASLELGDYIIVRVSGITNTDGWAQANIAGMSPWKEIPGANWDYIQVGDNAYVINDADLLSSIKTGGLGFQGKYYTLTNVYIAKPVTITLTSAGIGSMILPFAAEVPEGMTVYEVGSYEGSTLHLNSVNAIAANTPYIIKGTAKNYEFIGVAEAENFQYTVGNLCGTYEDIKAPVGSYVLQNGNSGAGFYRVVEGKQPTVNAHRAYLTDLPTTSSAKLNLVFDDETDGIRNVNESANSAADVIYNIAGQRVTNACTGIVIKNGKKYFVK